jgi:hypothetical protein
VARLFRLHGLVAFSFSTMAALSACTSVPDVEFDPDDPTRDGGRDAGADSPAPDGGADGGGTDGGGNPADSGGCVPSGGEVGCCGDLTCRGPRCGSKPGCDECATFGCTGSQVCCLKNNKKGCVATIDDC